MAFSAGMYFENGAGNIVFAEHQNAMLNAQRGNYVTNTAGNGGAVTANPTSNLTTTTADIDIADVDTFNNSTINSLTGITSIDLSQAYDDLAAGQSLYVLIYVKSNGVISNPTDAGGNEGVGTPATTGQQLPPAIPENSVPLALITLTNGDTTVDAADIEDYRIEGPQGGYFNGTFRVVESGIIAFDINESSGHVGIGAASNSNYGVFIDAPAEQIGSNQSFDRVRIDDQGAITVQTATTSTLVTTLHLEEPNIILTGTGAVTTAATFYVGGPPTEATNNYSILSDAGDVRFDASQVLFNDENDSDVLLFDYDLLNRIITTGAFGDTMAWTHWGALSINGDLDLNNSNLDDVASIDGGGNAVIFNDTLDLNGNNQKMGTTAFYNWSSGFEVIQGNRGAISFDTSSENTQLWSNVYFDGTNFRAMVGNINMGRLGINEGDIFASYASGSGVSADDIVSLTEVFFVDASAGNFRFTNLDIDLNGNNALLGAGGIGNNASVLTFGTGATGAATFGGDVGIGAVPTAANLHIQQTGGSDNMIYIFDDEQNSTQHAPTIYFEAYNSSNILRTHMFFMDANQNRLETSNDFHVNGALSKGSGTFTIDHPLDPYHRWLQHSFVESPDMMNIYKGRVKTKSNGQYAIAKIDMPDWFHALNGVDQLTFEYALTPHGKANVWVAEELQDGIFYIASDIEITISWIVYAVRHDPLAIEKRIKIELDKTEDRIGTLNYVPKGDYPNYNLNSISYNEKRRQINKQKRKLSRNNNKKIKHK